MTKEIDRKTPPSPSKDFRIFKRLMSELPRIMKKIEENKTDLSQQNPTDLSEKPSKDNKSEGAYRAIAF